jgi:hypothetical protein
VKRRNEVGAWTTFAVQVWDLSRVRGYCRHEHITTTMRYVHHTPAVEDANLLSAKLAADADSDAVFGTYSGPTRQVGEGSGSENHAFAGSS